MKYLKTMLYQELIAASKICIMLFLIVGCTTSQSNNCRVSGKGDGSSTQELVSQLRNLGIDVEFDGQAYQSEIFGIDAQILAIDGKTIQVFEYATIKDKQRIRAQISPDGYEISGCSHSHIVDWLDKPHFYEKDNLLILYVGSDPLILETLQNVIGPQFAGG